MVANLLAGKHLNGDIPVAIQVVATGPNVNEHELVHLAMIPLYPTYALHKTAHILDLYIKPTKPLPENPKNIARRCYNRAKEKGHELEPAQDIFDHWFDSLDIGRSRIAPIGYQYRIATQFIRKFIGFYNYEARFDDEEIRDIECVARFCNDVTDRRNEGFMYHNFTMAAFATRLNVPSDLGSATALTECAMIQRIYVGMMEAMSKRMLL